MSILVQVVFFIIAALILGAGVLTVTARNLVHAALWLIAAFFGVGALYMLMEAEFAAVTQVLIYVGAIAILILFGIMLTPDVSGEEASPIFRRRLPALFITAALFGLLILPALLNQSWSLYAPPEGAPATLASTREIGIAFMREYLLPFELASVLLLVALVGAIVIGFDMEARRRVLTLAEEFRLRQAAAARSQRAEAGQQPAVSAAASGASDTDNPAEDQQPAAPAAVSTQDAQPVPVPDPERLPDPDSTQVR